MNDDLVEQLYLCAEDYWGELACEAATRIEALTARNKVLEEALRVIRSEAERENGSWVHIKRCIAVQSAQALGGEQK